MKATLTILLVMFIFGAVAPGHHSGEAFAQARRKSRQRKVMRYACPMHPEVVSSSPGKCPKCGMRLRAIGNESKRPAEAPVSKNNSSEPVPNQADPTVSLHIPDVTVYDQNGKRLKFYTDLVKDKTVAINFIFTTCTTICPPLTATFRRVQQELGERHDVSLISVSVDPTTDTPERLKDFASKFKADSGWTFVTGDKVEIDTLLKALGAAVADKNDHTPTILIGNDSAGYWTRAYGLSRPTMLAEMIDNAFNRGSITR